MNRGETSCVQYRTSWSLRGLLVQSCNVTHTHIHTHMHTERNPLPSMPQCVVLYA